LELDDELNDDSVSQDSDDPDDLKKLHEYLQDGDIVFDLQRYTALSGKKTSTYN